jgi:hypothetical protein
MSFWAVGKPFEPKRIKRSGQTTKFGIVPALEAKVHCGDGLGVHALLRVGEEAPADYHVS